MIIFDSCANTAIRGGGRPCAFRYPTVPGPNLICARESSSGTGATHQAVAQRISRVIVAFGVHIFGIAPRH